MPRSHHALGFVLALLAAAGAAGSATAAATLQPDSRGQTYTLSDPSYYEEGCFAPCMCPVLLHQGLEGGFVLQPFGTEGGFDRFVVRNAKWIAPVSLGGGPLRAYGSGVYRIDRTAGLQQLELDLTIEGRGQAHLDSGLVPVTVEFPALSVAVAMNGFYCWDTAFGLVAKPQPRDEATTVPTETPGAQVLGAPQPATSWGAVKSRYGDGS